ncbi:hypothetical protein UG55_109627 [Frankia sp. EI5c]|uniref:hypothetical protein n=1 Tax=Frankia sp. EI5c TaxID=683316 RepID=UPI0007C2D704|nr:hypothetical protein [Frankia sp. EI5c]OAA18991.1 hypothetical protein UG55_109627 [Frankia sp. EI5c]
MGSSGTGEDRPSRAADDDELVVVLDSRETRQAVIREVAVPHAGEAGHQLVKVRIPAGVRDNTLIRLAARAPGGGVGRIAPGVLIRIRVTSSPASSAGEPGVPPPSARSSGVRSSGVPASGGSSGRPRRRRGFLLTASVLVLLLAGTTAGALWLTRASDPPVTEAVYQQALTTFDNRVGPAFGDLVAAATPDDVNVRAGQLKEALDEQRKALRGLTPPGPVGQAHAELVRALRDLADEAEEVAEAGGQRVLCTGASAAGDLGRSAAAERLRAAARSLAGSPSAGGYVAAAFLPARAEAARPPAAGTVFGTPDPDSRAYLEVDNARGDQDAVVSLVATGERSPRLKIYVRAYGTQRTAGIPNGAYQIYVTTGSEWDGTGFGRDCDFQRFDRTISYGSGTAGWDLTLQGTILGNADLDGVSPNSFPR